MTDHQYYNGNTSYVSTNSNTLNKSTSAALSRENLHQHRRTEPKHLQPPPSRNGGPGPHNESRHNQPDLIKDYGDMNSKPGYRSQSVLDHRGYHGHFSVDNSHHGNRSYQSVEDPHYQTIDGVSKSQGTNTKRPQREFQIYSTPQLKKGDLIQDAPSRSFNGIVNPKRETERSSSSASRPQSRGVSTKDTTLEVINMNYNSIQQQLEKNIVSKNRPASRMKSEESSSNNSSLNSSHNKNSDRLSSSQHQTSDGNTNVHTRTSNGLNSSHHQTSDRLSSSQNRSYNKSVNSQSRMTDRLSSSQHEASDRLSSSQHRSSDGNSQSRMMDRFSSSQNQARLSSSQLRSTDQLTTPHSLAFDHISNTPDQDFSSSKGDEKHQVARLSQEEIVRRRNESVISRKNPIEPPHLRKHVTEDFNQHSGYYQQFTPDKVSPIIPANRRLSNQEGPQAKSHEAEDSPSSRSRPPHERMSRLTKENLEQLRKPRNATNSKSPGVRQQPMGAEAVPRPATSMGFDRSQLPPHISKSQQKETQNMALRQKLQYLQRQKSAGTSPDVSKRDVTTPTHERQQNRPESRTQRWVERKTSYTTSTPAKGPVRQERSRSASRGAELSARDELSRTSRVLADSTNITVGQRHQQSDIHVQSKEPHCFTFQERSTTRWREIEKLMSRNSSEFLEGEICKSRDPLNYPFFSEFNKHHQHISTSLDSLNQEASQHLAETQTNKQLLAVNDCDSDIQGTPQLSSPVDFNIENVANYQSSSNEDLDMEVRKLLLQPKNQANPIEMALYQKLIDERIHEKMAALQDRRFLLEKKDNDLKFKRDKLQRRMQQMLARTSAVLNKSIELNKSRSGHEAELQEQARIPENAEELTMLHALSATIRPDSHNSSRNSNRHRQQHRPTNPNYRQESPVYANLPSSSRHDQEEYV